MIDTCAINGKHIRADASNDHCSNDHCSNDHCSNDHCSNDQVQLYQVTKSKCIKRIFPALSLKCKW